ncbi:MAG: 2-amino-4-hydroxy-6-hydroxymethyldihydropteridine diphosphokinase [Myxococcota bacterium]|nr:2-amino-4-hydroxy-6-hydroxymethyldihydropteridine diphosphokinase [Myxococcota bacterium]
MKTFLGLGANLGEPDRTIARAAAALDRVPGIRVLRLAPGYLSAPHGPPDQPPYVNSAVEIETGLEPRALLEATSGVEREIGRSAGAARWGPREIDIDILLYDDSVVREAGLEIPHPRMSERRFVLGPLADLDPGLRHPVDGRSIADLLAACADAPLLDGPWTLPRGVRGRLVDHGGDLGLLAEGDDPADLAVQAAHLFVGAIVPRDLLRERERREWAAPVPGPRDVGDAVADLLNEIVLWLDADGLLPARVAAVESAGELRAVAFGETIRGRDLPVERCPKMVTRHGLRVSRIRRTADGRARGGRRIRLVVDM